MGLLVLDNVSKCFAGPRRQIVGAVRNLNLSAADGEFLVIVGPSGCGKTTTLRLIAGLETPDGGSLSLDEKPLAGVPPKDRDVAMVFQNHALLPHLTVVENLAFGLMLRRMPREQIAQRVRAAAEMLGLTPLLERKPPALSGGECQRVALGRALARHPRVFLFDEPLSNLDAPLRLQLRGEIAALRRRAGATMVYVTHDQAEAMALADRVAVMKDGALQQAAPPLELYRRPANRFVAGFIGSPPMNFFQGLIDRHNGAVVFRADAGFALPVEADAAKSLEARIGQPVTLGLRPEHIADGAGVAALVERVEATGAENFLYCASNGVRFVSRMPAARAAQAGENLALRFDMDHAHFFDPSTGQALS
ncbi:MAG: ABC transporter ATP-binding protein [Verrucomicrobiota bacterium]|jgi:multiple sugar transport system ATP-binding protein